MGFWGIEVKPGKKVNPFQEDDLQGRLHVTQATLGLGSSVEKSILQCFREDKPPIFICTLLPEKIESCSLDLEFDDEDSVSFSVMGTKSIHLSGYLLADDENVGDEYRLDSFGEDGLDTGSEESSQEFGSEDLYEDDYTDTSDDEIFAPSSRVRNSGVLIEEITEDDKPADGNPLSKKQKKNRPSDSKEDSQSQRQIVVRNSSSIAPVESEDEDGFPISISHGGNATILKPGAISKQKKETTGESKKKVDNVQDENKKREEEGVEQDNQPDRKRKRKKRQKNKELDKEVKVDTDADGSTIAPSMNDQSKTHDLDQALPEGNQHDDEPLSSQENQSEKKKKKKKKSQQPMAAAGEANRNQPTTDVQDRSASKVERKEQDDAKPSQIRTFPNGLVIEELAMGKPDGRRAAPGKQVSVHYVGKLKKNGKIFDSNVGRAPFKFRLGIGQVIKGWDVGVNGMRIGDKRRLTIPPAMGYGAQGAGGKIPPNSWLVFDVELVDVR